MYNPNNTSELGDMTFCKVPLAEPTVHAGHPFKNKATHEKLLKYLRQRLHLGKQARDSELSRLVRIDQNVAGWMKLSEEDKKRDQQKAEDGSPQAVAINLPLTYVHLDDMMTYFAQTFAPTRGMFFHTGKPDETDQAAQIVTLMNNHAIYSGYFRQVLLGIWSILKYNRGGYHCFWSREEGPKLVRDPASQTDRLDMQLRWQGNRLEAIDMYNFLCDPLVHPTQLHEDGEFAAIATIKSHYWLQKKASQGVYFNCARALEAEKGLVDCKYYRSPPQEAMMDQSDSSGSGSNWVSILSEATGYTSASGYELVEISIRLNPTEFGLVQGNNIQRQPRNRLETWRFTVLNDEYIIEAQHLNNIHGYLPFFLGLLNDDLMGTSQKGAAEILTPLQDFASFLMNTHVHATRSSIWGLTVYDPTMVNLRQIPKGEVAATIPLLPAGYGKDVRTAVYKPTQTLETKQTLSDLSGVMDMINQFFPTQSLPSQIASIDRAVDRQVAAVQQGANRRQQKAARLLDDSVFRNIRFAMYYNIIQYQPDESEVTDFYTGKAVKIDLGKLRNTDLPYVIGQGLKSLDRQSAADALQQLIFALIQAPQAAQGIDVLGLIDYWTSMMDIDINMKQFRLAPPTPEGQPVDPNAAAATPGAEAGINPATDPQALTSPIY